MYQSLWKISFLVIFCIGCANNEKPSPLPYYNSPDFNPQFLIPPKANNLITHHIDKIDVVDQGGQPIITEDLKGKIHIANFFFTRCAIICPPMMQNLKSIVNEFSNDSSIIFLSYSVTPWSDSVATLKNYVAENKFNFKNWHLCTGNTASIYTLARRYYFAEESLGYSRDSTEFLHTEHVLLIDPELRIRGIYNASLKLEMEQLTKDIYILKNEY
jgi:protein SCO1/2